jgi:hypothetical protein
MVVAKSGAFDPNATMLVPGRAPESSSNDADSAGPASPDDLADRDDPDDSDESETPVEVLEDLTGNRARAADDSTPPDSPPVGTRP